MNVLRNRPLIKRGITLTLVAMLLAIPARADLYFDNVNEAVSGNVSADPAAINNFLGYAQSFITDHSAASFTLNTVTLSMGGVQGSPDELFYVNIYNDNGNQPGTSLQLLSGDNYPDTPVNYSYSALLTLQPDTTYWVVAHAFNTSGNFLWNYTDSSAITGNWTTSGWTDSTDGITWSPVAANAPQMMSIEATPNPVPEPSTWGLLLGTFATGCAVLRRMRKV